MTNVTVVTGTLNRLWLLQDMVESARKSCQGPLTLDFVIVDGGSTDGTQDWCKQQADVTLIEHGQRLGAIRAFCDGAKAATGDYVVLANDDIVFIWDSITRAFVYLESHPEVGAVAFEDDRQPPQGPKQSQFSVQTMEARNGDGTLTQAVPYAQVGMFRRWLGDMVGWWGADDNHMSNAHTYGGDNYLSARLWEMGYSVEPVELCRVRDLVHKDDLREENQRRELEIGSRYHARFPHGPYVGSLDKPANPQREALRILYLPIYEPGFGQYKSGLRNSLAAYGLVWELDYLNSDNEMMDIVESWQPHLMLTQLHGTDVIDAEYMQKARRMAPNTVVVNWNGDVYPAGLTSDDMLELLQHVDLQLVVNADVLPVYEQHGINAEYWQVAYEPVIGDLPDVAAHDVVFLGNCYSEQRQGLGGFLRSLKGVDVGIYGRGWQDEDGDTLYDFATSRALYQSAKIAIGDNQWGDKGFVSNRIFDALASGVLLLHQRVPELQQLTGLKDGVHYIAWDNLGDLHDKLSYWLDGRRKTKVEAIAQAGKRYVRTQHSFDHRVSELWAMLEALA